MKLAEEPRCPEICMGTRMLPKMGWSCWLLGCLVATCAAGRTTSLTTAELVLDLARDHGLNCRGKQTASDVRQVRTLLRAAVKLDPRLTDAYAWLHELAVLRGDKEEAAEMVRRLVTVDPEHVGAFARWLQVGLDSCQTIERREEWLTTVLQSTTGRPELQAMVHVRLGRLALSQLEHDTVRKHVSQALVLDPLNPEAAALQLELLGDDTEPHVRLAAGLLFLQLSPFHVDTAWQVATLLDRYGFHKEAARFYEHAVEIYQRSNPGLPMPGAHLLQLARHAQSRGDLPQAVQYASEAITVDPVIAAEAGMFLYWLYVQQDHPAQADEVRKQLADRFAALRDPDEWPVNEITQAAWFYCTLEKQSQRALMLAESAAARMPEDVFVRRVLGWAQLANLQEEAAEKTLLPIATRDPYAAYQLAKRAQAAGDTARALEILVQLEMPPDSGPAHELLAELGLNPATSQPAERYPDISAALTAFNHDVLVFHRNPEQFFEAQVVIENRGPRPGEPWWAGFALTNRADFPITLGPELMVNPVFLVSFQLEGDREREYAHLLTINLDHRRVIKPGQTVRIRRTIDIGPLRRVSRRTPQQAQRVTVRTIFDPVLGPDGQWQAGLGGRTLPPAYFNRLPAGTSREALHAMFSALTDESEAARFRAIEALAELLSEQQRLERGRLNYQPEPVPSQRISQALLAALSSESWELRVRALDALQIAGMDSTMLRAVESCLEHSHWMVRLMAVRLLGERRGPAAEPRIKRLAENDTDELVRELTGSYLAAWASRQTATQPAGGD
ncbi:MAG: HEAT repeat domain-containing protein [Planctomycetota bacterium]